MHDNVIHMLMGFAWEFHRNGSGFLAINGNGNNYIGMENGILCVKSSVIAS